MSKIEERGTIRFYNPSSPKKMLLVAEHGAQYAYFDIGKTSFGDLEKEGKLEPRVKDIIKRRFKISKYSLNNHRSFIISGDNKVVLGEDGLILSSTVIRTDELPENSPGYLINGTIATANTLHSQNRNIIGEHTETSPFVILHGTTIGKEVKIGFNSILDGGVKVADRVRIGECCYMGGDMNITKNVPSGTIFLDKKLVINLPPEIIKKHIKESIALKRSINVMVANQGYTDHPHNMREGVYVDPFAITRYNTIIDIDVTNIYLGPFSVTENCRLLGSDINRQEFNSSLNCVFFGNNVGAHGSHAINTIFHMGSGQLFNSRLYNLDVAEGTIFGPGSWAEGKSQDVRLKIPPYKYINGYITEEILTALVADYNAATRKGESMGKYVKDGKIIATMEDISQALKERYGHILHDNSKHAYKSSKYVAIPLIYLYEVGMED